MRRVETPAEEGGLRAEKPLLGAKEGRRSEVMGF